MEVLFFDDLRSSLTASRYKVNPVKTTEYHWQRSVILESQSGISRTDARIGAGLTRAEVAGRLGVPQSFVSKYETGERRLDVGEVQAICRVLGLSLVEFAVALGEREGRGKPGT